MEQKLKEQKLLLLLLLLLLLFPSPASPHILPFS